MTASQQDAGLSAEQLDDLYNPDGDGEHSQITRAMWRHAVAQQDTVSGYWQWLAHKLSDDTGSTAKPALTITEGPAFCAPLNAPPGLYVKVLSGQGRVSESTLLEFAREAVLKAGYDPDGKGLVGLPAAHGVLTSTYAMWFYDKVKPQQSAAAEEPLLHFLVIQEGGTSTELYVHSLETAADAEDHRVDCAQNGAYRTTPCVEVPASLAEHPQFYDIAEKLVRAVTELDLVQVPADTESN